MELKNNFNYSVKKILKEKGFKIIETNIIANNDNSFFSNAYMERVNENNILILSYTEDYLFNIDTKIESLKQI